MNSDNNDSERDILTGLIDRILAGKYDSSTLRQVMDLVYVSRNPQPLMTLLEGPGRAQIRGLYILAEIGRVARPLLSKAVEFTAHPDWEARFWALNCILSCAEPSDGAALAAGIRLLADPDERVRSKALDFMSRLSSAKIRAAKDALPPDEEGSALATALSRLLTYSVDSVDQILIDAKSDDWFSRASAMAFAARGMRVGKKIATKGSRSRDSVTSEFAKSVL